MQNPETNMNMDTSLTQYSSPTAHLERAAESIEYIVPALTTIASSLSDLMVRLPQLSQQQQQQQYQPQPQEPPQLQLHQQQQEQHQHQIPVDDHYQEVWTDYTSARLNEILTKIEQAKSALMYSEFRHEKNDQKMNMHELDFHYDYDAEIVAAWYRAQSREEFSTAMCDLIDKFKAEERDERDYFLNERLDKRVQIQRSRQSKGAAALFDDKVAGYSKFRSALAQLRGPKRAVCQRSGGGFFLLPINAYFRRVQTNICFRVLKHEFENTADNCWKDDDDDYPIDNLFVELALYNKCRRIYYHVSYNMERRDVVKESE
ncbi:hypothetical protein EDD11_008731, partial [Mortierella claussenii]